MRHVMVRYRVKPERISEHEALIRPVFEELNRTAPRGIEYGAFRLPDGESYAHIAFVSAEVNPLLALATFQAFTSQIAERCAEPPNTVELTPIGTYRFASSG